MQLVDGASLRIRSCKRHGACQCDALRALDSAKGRVVGIWCTAALACWRNGCLDSAASRVR